MSDKELLEQALRSRVKSKLIKSDSIIDKPRYVVFTANLSNWKHSARLKIGNVVSVHCTKYDAVHNARILKKCNLSGWWREIDWEKDEANIWQLSK